MELSTCRNNLLKILTVTSSRSFFSPRVYVGFLKDDLATSGINPRLAGGQFWRNFRVSRLFVNLWFGKRVPGGSLMRVAD